MTIIRPFESYVVKDEHAAVRVTPAYDALTPEERYVFASQHPDNFINVMRSLDEFTGEERPTLDDLLSSNALSLKRILESGAYRYKDKPCLYLYRLSVDEHVQTGVVGEISIDEYDSGHVKKHEHTRSDHEDQLTRYHEVVGASSSPVCLAYSQHDAIDHFVNQLVSARPIVDFVTEDGVAQILWCVEDPAAIERLQALFSEVHTAFLTDGHHRSASGSRYTAKRRATNPNHVGDEAYNFLLVALFPHDQLRVLSYHRCVKDLNGYEPERLLAAVGHAGFDVERMVNRDHAVPRRRGELSMWLDHGWYRLIAKPDSVPADDPVRSLDVSILQERILGPVLGIADSRHDSRLDYVPGVGGLAGLEARCQTGWRVGFACYPTSLEQLMAVANADAVMPPKSTWFDPKARSGLFIRMR